VSTSASSLASDASLLPLSLLDPVTASIADAYDTAEGRLPLVIGTYADGGHRAAVAWWVGADESVPVDDLDTLIRLLDTWDGSSADAEHWIEALTTTRDAATEVVNRLAARAVEVQEEGSQRRIGAARRRLQLELGRYLVAHGEGTSDLNSLMYRLMQGTGDRARRLKRALELIGGYPDWTPTQIQDLDDFDQELTEYRRKSRLSGMEVDAALGDPRWLEEIQVA
jgi:hypothetical protein